MTFALTAEGVTKRYGDTAALADVSFQLAPGEVLAIIGANGAGKSTLIKSLVGLVRFQGSITVGSVDVARHAKAARRLIGYLPQNPAFHPDLTVEETARFFADLHDAPLERARSLLVTVGLEPHIEKQVRALSGGMRQRLALAIALLGDPPLLVLDEPGSGLDTAARLELRQLVQEQRALGKAIALSTHWLEDVPYIADHVLLLEGGRTAFLGSAAEFDARLLPDARLYLRLNGHGAEAVPLIHSLFPQHPVERSGDWVVITCPARHKVEVIEALVDASVSILDLRVEEPPAISFVKEEQ